MIVLHAERENGRHELMVILEPGNIEKLKLGQPIPIDSKKFLGELGTLDFAVAYTPDAVFVAQEYERSGDIAHSLAESMFRPEVFVRDPEAVKRAF